MSLLRVNDLAVSFAGPNGPVEAVRSLSFTLDPRETLGIVGESGSGKTQAALAMMGLLPANGRAEGSVRLGDEEILNRGERILRRVRGRRIAMVFQDPMTALNPHLSIGRQLVQALEAHRSPGREAARAEALSMLDAVRLPAARERFGCYPHEFSGGMRQRVLIAAALLARPEVLIADEPTTALDVTVQAGILKLLGELQDAFATAMILITHDLGVIAGRCDRVLVMEAGEVLEQGEAGRVFGAPEHPRTRELLEAVPRLDEPLPPRPPHAGEAQPVLTVENLEVRYPERRRAPFARRGRMTAVDSVGFELGFGETLGVVGESGCGKSSLARALLRLVPVTAGRVLLLGRDLAALERRALRRARADLQLVFQDPLASLDPRMTVGRSLAEPLDVHRPELDRAARRERVLAMLGRVGLDAAMADRYPHEFSGGQCQRIGIARALVTEPRVVICDEAVSALDVTVQAAILELLATLQRELGVAILFIAHDLAVVRRVSHRVLVMYLGRVVELADAATLYERPRHPYTRALLDAAPIPDPRIERERLARAPDAEPPSAAARAAGCAYRERCAWAIERCRSETPQLEPAGGGARAACHRRHELELAPGAQAAPPSR